MLFQEDDMDFDRLDWQQFEELCYDLLVRFGYHSMAWRQGDADQGRDIEARRYITHNLVSPYPEKWFIECKRHTQGLPVHQNLQTL